MRLTSPATAQPASSPDLDLVAQRIVKLAEIATLEHLEALLSSQAAGVVLESQRHAASGLAPADA